MVSAPRRELRLAARIEGATARLRWNFRPEDRDERRWLRYPSPAVCYAEYSGRHTVCSWPTGVLVRKCAISNL